MARFTTRARSAARRKGLSPVAAFTLVEVILAIGLASGLLLVALTFYHQAAEMRRQVLRESERVSTMRLIVDRLAGDLRAVQPKAGPGNEFTGDSNSMSFVKLACTSLPPNVPLGAKEQTDLVRVSLATLFVTNGTRVAVSGLDRSESPLTPPAASVSLATNSDDLSVGRSDQTNLVTEPFADIVRFVRFRYWDGTAWQFSWTNPATPPGVELVLSSVASAEDAEADTYPPEAFRRVVVVPGGLRHGGSDTGSATNSAIP